MNLAKRANFLKAHNLRCQGLTYRQIAEQMACAHSTAAHYVRQFEQHRSEIIETLAADLLVHSVAGIQTADPDLHAQHIHSTRELRLLLNSLDQVEDRRQRRERRIHENNVKDSADYFEGMEEIAKIMLKTGHWDPNEDINPQLEPIFGPIEHQPPDPQTSPTLPQTSPTGGGAPQGRRGPPTAPPPPTPEQPHPNPAQRASQPAQNRTESNKPEQKPAQSPAKPAKSRSKGKKSRRAARKQRQTQTQIPRPARTTSPDDIPDPPFDPRRLRSIGPGDHRVQKLFGNRG